VASLISTVGIKLDTGGAPQKLKVLEGGAKKVEKAFDRLAGKSGKASKGVGLFGNAAALTGIKAKAGAVGIKVLNTAMKSTVGMMAGFTAGIAGIGAAFNTLSGIEFAAAKFETLGGNSDVLIDKLKLVAIELNGSASTAELTGAAYDVASAGFSSAADAALVLKAASQGATGGFSDINTVGNAATSVLNAYGKSAEEAGFLVDQFIQTQNDGKIIVAQYAAGIGKVASVAASLKVPLKEINAAMALATATGVNAEIAFTGLKASLARLSGPRAQKHFERLGLEINATTLAQDGLLKTLQKLEGLDMGDLIAIFGQEAIQTMAPVLNNLERYAELIKNQEEASGAAAAAQIRASNTIQGAWKRVANSFGNLFADQSELGAAIRITLQGISVVIDGLAIAIKTLVFPFRLLFKLLGGIGVAFEEQFGKGNGAIVLITKSWTFFLEKVEKGFQLVEAVATAIGTAIGSIALAFDPLFKVIPEVITDAKERFMNFATGLRDIFVGLAEIISKIFKRIFDFISKGIKRVWDAIPDKLKQFLKGAGEKVASVASSAAQPFAEGFNDLKGDLAGWNQDEEGNQRFIDMSKFQDAIAKAGGDINAAWKEYLGTVKETNKELEKGTSNTENKSVPAVNKLKEAFEQVKETIASGLHSAVMGLIDGTKSLGESLAGIAKQIASLMLKKAIFGAFGLPMAEGGYVKNGIRPFASGGLVTKPTVGLVGEAGEDEYVIPASKMAQSMQRYSAGARGDSVIPGTGQSSAGGASGSSTTVNYSGPLLSFNSEDYVPKSAVGQIINSAASKGAAAGEARTMSTLRNSRGSRARVGI
jgi:TP901 family phage tail tape measure protein